MTNKIYLGVNNQAKEVKKIYIGINGQAKKVKKGYIGVNGVSKLFYQDSILPEEYQQVEYIMNSGTTQIIDPNIYPDSDTKTFIDFEISSYVNNGNGHYLFGCDNDGKKKSSDSGVTFYYWYYVTINASSMWSPNMAGWGKRYSIYGSGTDYTQLGITPSVGDRIKILFYDENGRTYINDSLKFSTTITFSKEAGYLYDRDARSYSSTARYSKMYLLGAECRGTSANGQPTTNIAPFTRAEVKLYQFSVWQNGNLVRNMYPCYRKSGNVIGMYDIVGKTFYTNVGTGVFRKGPNIS